MFEGKRSKSSEGKPKKKPKTSTAVGVVANVEAPAADEDVEEKYLPNTRKERCDKGQVRMTIKRPKRGKGVRKVLVNQQWKSIDNV